MQQGMRQITLAVVVALTVLVGDAFGAPPVKDTGPNEVVVINDATSPVPVEVGTPMVDVRSMPPVQIAPGQVVATQRPVLGYDQAAVVTILCQYTESICVPETQPLERIIVTHIGFQPLGNTNVSIVGCSAIAGMANPQSPGEYKPIAIHAWNNQTNDGTVVVLPVAYDVADGAQLAVYGGSGNSDCGAVLMYFFGYHP